MKIAGRSPHAPHTPKMLRVSVQYGCETSRQLVEIIQQQQRYGQPIQLVKLLGKPSEQPNILPRQVVFADLMSAAADHTTDALVLLRGPLAKQFEVASRALQSGKQLIVADVRLMQAYGDVLNQMATAYATRIHTGAGLAHLGALARTLQQQSTFGVQDVWHYIADGRNTHLAQQEATETILQTPDFAPMDMTVLSALQGETAGKWTRPIQPPLPLPSPHAQQIAARLGGGLRFLAHVNAHCAEIKLAFLPQQHPLWQGEHTTQIVGADGSQQVLHAVPSENAQVQALLQDVLAGAYQKYNARVETVLPANVQTPQQSLIFTQTAAWREARDTFVHQVLSEQLIGTTLVVTVVHQTPLAIAPELGTVCALPAGEVTAQQAPRLRVAN